VSRAKENAAEAEMIMKVKFTNESVIKNVAGK